MKNLIYDKHYINKSHTKHYYMGNIFSNKEWYDFIHEKTVKGKRINITSKYRKPPKQCDRWLSINKIAIACTNKPFYRSTTNIYFCKKCAHEVSKVNPTLEFERIK